MDTEATVESGWGTRVSRYCGEVLASVLSHRSTPKRKWKRSGQLQIGRAHPTQTPTALDHTSVIDGKVAGARTHIPEGAGFAELMVKQDAAKTALEAAIEVLVKAEELLIARNHHLPEETRLRGQAGAVALVRLVVEQKLNSFEKSSSTAGRAS